MIYRTFSSLSSQSNFHPATLTLTTMFTSAISQLGSLQVTKLNIPLDQPTGKRTTILIDYLEFIMLSPL